jgi:hypothetical protein
LTEYERYSLAVAKHGASRDIARQRGEKESTAQRHEREDAAISVKTATTRAREVGSDHPRVRRNTIAKSEAMAVRFQNICMA